MHFRVTETFTFLFGFLSIFSMANPLSSSPRDIAVKNELDARQEGAGTDIIIEGEQSYLILTHTTNALTVIP